MSQFQVQERGTRRRRRRRRGSMMMMMMNSTTSFYFAATLLSLLSITCEALTSQEPTSGQHLEANLDADNAPTDWRLHYGRQYVANYSTSSTSAFSSLSQTSPLSLVDKAATNGLQEQQHPAGKLEAPGVQQLQPQSAARNEQWSPLGDSAKQQALALALDKEANKLINDELCRNFTYGIQTENGGIITSPNYPNPYPTNLICFRLIEAPVGHYIVLEFRDQFHIEEAGNECENDKIEIRDGRYGYSKVLARYCGNKFPPEVKSSNEAMWLRFISDSSISHTGFKAVYRFEKKKTIKPNPPSECRFNVTSLSTNVPNANNNGTIEVRTGIHSGVIKNSDVPDTLLNYSRDFNVSLECIWNITVMPGWKIYLTFANYELNKPNDCDSNFIEIYEENLTEENQTVKFCGTRTEPQQSKSNVFNIRHHAIPTALSSRFEIIYTAFRDKGSEGCDATREFDCDDGTCIHESLKCDSQVNCKYRYDEASEPGPCLGVDPEGSFFETEHMVIILIVFLTLVTGMCASIVVSCWGKIQERRRRKQEYHMRKSREQSMEGQLNKVDQMIYSASNNNNNNANSGVGVAQGTGVTLSSKANSKLTQRVISAESQQQLTNNQHHQLHNNNNNLSVDSNNNINDSATELYLPSNAALPGAQQQLIAASNGAIYGLYGSNKQQFGVRGGQKIHPNDLYDINQQQQQQLHRSAGIVNRSLSSLQHSLLSTVPPPPPPVDQLQQQLHNLLKEQQHSVPDTSSANNNNIINSQSLKNQQQQQQIPNLVKQSSLIAAHDAQNMLNFTSIHRNQPQQQQQKFISSIYPPQQQHAHDNNENSTADLNNQQFNTYSLRRQQQQQQQNHLAMAINGIPSGQPTTTVSAAATALLNQSASAQTMPISLAKYNQLIQASQQQQQQDAAKQAYEVAAAAAVAHQQQLTNYNQPRALTLSTMHKPASFRQQQHYLPATGTTRNLQTIYGVNPQLQQQQQQQANFSSSMSCCNVPLHLDDCSLVGAAGGETPLISDLVARSNELARRSQQQRQLQELKSRTMNPRQASLAIPRSISAHQLSKSQVQQQQQQQFQQQQQQQQQHHHQQQQQQQLQQLAFKSSSDVGNHAKRYAQPPNHSLSYPHACTGLHRPGEESPALPPPPPPPHMIQVRQQSTTGNQQQQQQQPVSDSRRAAFKVSRVDQQTGDSLQGVGDLLSHSTNMQFNNADEVSTAESDATFGMLVSLTTPLNRPIVLAHLAECNLIRQQQQRAQLSGGSGAAKLQLIGGCNCGAFERAKQLQSIQQQQQQQQQQQFHHLQQVGAGGSSHELDESDDLPCLLQQRQQQQQQQQQQLISPTSKTANFVSLDLNSIQLMNSGILRNSSISMEALVQQKQIQHSNINNNNNLLVGGYNNNATNNNNRKLQQRQQYSRFRQQSSELTNEDEEDDDEDEDEDCVGNGDDDEEEEIDEEEVLRCNNNNEEDEVEDDDDDVREEMELDDGYNLDLRVGNERDDDDEDESSGCLAAMPAPPLQLPATQQQQQNATSKQLTGKATTNRSRSVVRSEELRDAPNSRHLSGSHTSISCQSCTCGSQLQLDKSSGATTTVLQGDVSEPATGKTDPLRPSAAEAPPPLPPMPSPPLQPSSTIQQSSQQRLLTLTSTTAQQKPPPPLPATGAGGKSSMVKLENCDNTTTQNSSTIAKT